MEKKFGLLVGLILLIVVTFKFQEFSNVTILLMFSLACLIMLISLLRPSLIKPLTMIWIKLGNVLGKVVQPIMILAIFVAVFVPLGVLFRLLNKDLLNLELSSNQRSYWHIRKKFNVENMKYQF